MKNLQFIIKFMSEQRKEIKQLQCVGKEDMIQQLTLASLAIVLKFLDEVRKLLKKS